MFYGDVRATPMAPVSAPAARILYWIAGLAVKAAHAVENRRLLLRLGQLDDRMLQDIGLHRSDLRDATAAPNGTRAVDILEMRRRERRASSRELAARR